MKRTALLLAAAGALVMPAAGLAHGRTGIVINDSIAGVRLGMSSAQVRAVSGKPPQIVHAGKAGFVYNYGSAGQLEVGFDRVQGKMVVTQVTLEPDYRNLVTSKHVGLGSTKNAVLHAYPTAKFDNAIGQIWIDQLGTHDTSFLLSRSNHVIQIAVSWNYG